MFTVWVYFVSSGIVLLFFLAIFITVAICIYQAETEPRPVYVQDPYVTPNVIIAEPVYHPAPVYVYNPTPVYVVPVQNGAMPYTATRPPSHEAYPAQKMSTSKSPTNSPVNKKLSTENQKKSTSK
uniref:Uncharacterized protein n=1 Tax=Caenorhabditis japonica TaxID=281687 RepID=A0A8R1ERZ7_CAEJA